MEVHEDDARLRAKRLDFAEDDAKGSSSGLMKMRPMTLTTPTGSPVRVRPRYDAAPGHARRKVGGAEQFGLPRNVVQDLLLVPDMVA